MNLVERQLADPGHQPFEPASIVVNAPLVLVLDYEFGCRLLEGPWRSDAVNLGLTSFFNQSREILLRFREAKVETQSNPEGDDRGERDG
jgi:hypothetical protein